MELKYKRISLKLSGEALGGNGETVNPEAVDAVADEIKTIIDAGAEVCVTIGGGNMVRGRSSAYMDRNRADQMGMLATVINSLALEDALLRKGVSAKVMSSVAMPRICREYNSREAQELIKNNVVIFAGGSGVPFFSTDTAAALKAAEMGADALLLAKNVDAVYSADPKVVKDAVRYDKLTYDDVITRGLNATDMTAITLCKEQKIPILVFALKVRSNILKAIAGENIGTLID